MQYDNPLHGKQPKKSDDNQVFFLFIASFISVGIILSGCQSASTTLTPTLASKSSNYDVIHLTTGEWSPYDGEDLPHYGCSPWLISEAFALEGIQVEFGFFTWARGYQLAKEGSWDGAIDWADTPEHRDNFYLSDDHLTEQQFVFFHRSDNDFQWETMDDLSGKVVGITNGYIYGDAFKDILQKGTVTFETASSDEANFRKLLAGRIDVFPMERRVGYFILQKYFSPEEIAQIVHNQHPIDTFKPYLLLSKAVPDNRERMKKFNQGWKKLKDSGRIEEILKNCAP